ncbi:hypothetical protein VTH06DRAFT_5345 [Thermothelomyces fergusii]
MPNLSKDPNPVPGPRLDRVRKEMTDSELVWQSSLLLTPSRAASALRPRNCPSGPPALITGSLSAHVKKVYESQPITTHQLPIPSVFSTHTSLRPDNTKLPQHQMAYSGAGETEWL